MWLSGSDIVGLRRVFNLILQVKCFAKIKLKGRYEACIKFCYRGLYFL